MVANLERDDQALELFWTLDQIRLSHINQK